MNADNALTNYETQSKQFFSDGHSRAALIILEKGLTHDPDELNLLSMYVEMSKKIFAAFPSEDRIEPLARLEEFVLSRLAYTSLEHAHEIIHIAAGVANVREALLTDLGKDEDVFDENDLLWKRAQAGHLNPDDYLDENSDNLEQTICKMESMLEQLPSRLTEEAAVERIAGALAKAKLAQAFDIAHNEIEMRIAHCLYSSDDPLAVYSLQQAETLLRNFAVDAEKFGVRRREIANKTHAQLKAASEKLADKARETDAHTKWEEFWSANRDTFNRIKHWADPSGSAQEQLKKLNEMIYVMQGIVPSLAGTEAGKEAFTTFNEAGNLLGKIAVTQQRRYDKWAISQVRKGYKNGSEHAGIIDDEEKIARALIDDFGPIDTRLLSSEVQRTYSEVFELLFERLDKPSKDEKKDYKNKGGKLYTLKAMMDITKKSLSEF